MHGSSTGFKQFVRISINKFIFTWVAIRRNPIEQTLVLANNVTADDRGFAHATAKNGIVLNAMDIDWICRAVGNSTMFYEKANTAKAQHARLLIAEWDNSSYGRTTFEVEATPCLGQYVIFKQGRGRINGVRIAEFVYLLRYMGIQVNAGKKEREP